MQRLVGPIVLAALLVTSWGVACGDDKVSVRYFAGYPLPGRSMERLDVLVERQGASMKTEEQDVDRYFSLVQTALADHQVVRDWQVVIPDAPFVQITIELGGRKLQLASAHVILERSGQGVVTERGLEALGNRDRASVLAQQSEPYRQHRLAFEKILSLTLDRVRARLGP
jgi:hypothetical protein